MVVLNWLILLAVSEKLSHDFSVSKGDYVSSPTVDDANKKITGKGSYTVLSIYGRTYTH